MLSDRSSLQKKWAFVLAVFTVGGLTFALLLWMGSSWLSTAHAAASEADPQFFTSAFDSHGFRDVRVFAPAVRANRKGVILLLKPQWLKAEAEDVAVKFNRDRRLVILVDPSKFSVPSTKAKRQCGSLSDCMVALSAYVQKREKFKEIMMPTVLAVGETGEMAEEAWREAPLASFNSIISIDYCPKSVVKPQLFAEHRTLWSVLRAYDTLENCGVVKSPLLPLADIEIGVITASPRLRTGPMIRWVNEHLDQLDQLQRRPASIEKVNLDDLGPVVLEPSGQAKAKATYDEFMVLYSGDGGWAEFTDELANGVNKLSIPVVGVNSMRYFWKEKSPQVGADDLQRMIRYYLAKWKAKRVHLVGFSFGAGTLPFFLNRLPEDLRRNVGKVALLAPYRKADFVFSLSDWFFDSNRGAEVLPEIRSITTTARPLCIYPAEERSQSLCTQDPDAPLTVVELPGGHHFGKQTERVVKVIFPESRL